MLATHNRRRQRRVHGRCIVSTTPRKGRLSCETLKGPRLKSRLQRVNMHSRSNACKLGSRSIGAATPAPGPASLGPHQPHTARMVPPIFWVPLVLRSGAVGAQCCRQAAEHATDVFLYRISRSSRGFLRRRHSTHTVRHIPLRAAISQKTALETRLVMERTCYVCFSTI